LPVWSVVRLYYKLL